MQRFRIRPVFLWVLPKIALSRWAGKFAEIRFPKWLLDFFIKIFVRCYRIDMKEACSHSFETFNEFFTRKLHPVYRPIVGREDVVISPVDGIVGAFGKVADNTLLQAKGISYSLRDLCVYPHFSDIFAEGHYVTLYLSPRHYHRIHAPVTGAITDSCYIPGTLYPVNSFAVRNINALFTLNERWLTLIEHPSIGRVAVVKIGATVVGKIEVSYDRARPHRKILLHRRYCGLHIARGEELGRFIMGSTVILLFEHNKVSFVQALSQEREVKWGEAIAELVRK